MKKNKFTLYLEAVKFCRQAGISVDNIERHGELWKRHWTVNRFKPKSRKDSSASTVSNQTT